MDTTLNLSEDECWDKYLFMNTPEVSEFINEKIKADREVEKREQRVRNKTVKRTPVPRKRNIVPGS